jgi:hypothetical protein
MGRQKAFDRVNWTQLMPILKRTGIDWYEGRLIIKLYMGQSVKLKLDQGERRLVRLDEQLDKDAVRHRFYSTCTANTLTRKLLKGFGDFKIRG